MLANQRCGPPRIVHVCAEERIMGRSGECQNRGFELGTGVHGIHLPGKRRIPGLGAASGLQGRASTARK